MRNPGQRNAAERRRPLRKGQPAVLFFDDFGLEQFDQLASSLRRRGIAAIRLTSGRSRRKRPPRSFTRPLRDKWIYDACLPLSSPEAITLLSRGRLGGYDLVDVLLAESAVAAIGLDDPRLDALGKHALAFASRPPRQLLDKFEAGALLGRAGIRVPPQRRAGELTPVQAAETLGLPLVVKAPVGLAGDGVRIAHSVSEIEEALKELCGSNRRCGFYQKFVEGRTVCYGCVRGPDGPLIEHGFVIGAAQWQFGPSANVKLHDDATLLDAGRRVVNTLGCEGFAQIDFLQDAEGELWAIDANLRPWGNVVSFLCLDIDFTTAYASVILDRPYIQPGRPGAAASRPEAYVFPFALYDSVRVDPLSQVASISGRFAGMCRNGPGSPYAMFVAAKASALLARRFVRQPLRLLHPRLQPKEPAAPS